MLPHSPAAEQTSDISHVAQHLTAAADRLDEMIADFAKHTAEVGDFARLHAGRSIGNGAAEGPAKRTGRRIKVAGGDWGADHPDVMDAAEWPALWDGPAARPPEPRAISPSLA